MAKRAWVMVLGDVGRSPRMQYHTLSLCETVRARRKPVPWDARPWIAHQKTIAIVIELLRRLRRRATRCS
jgi:hypothetical protein